MGLFTLINIASEYASVQMLISLCEQRGIGFKTRKTKLATISPKRWKPCSKRLNSFLLGVDNLILTLYEGPQIPSN